MRQTARPLPAPYGGSLLPLVLWGLLHTPVSASGQIPGTFSATGNLNQARAGHTATLLKNGRVLIAGGWDSTARKLSSAEIYDPETEAFQPTGNLATPRSNHAAALLGDGRVLITGGYTIDCAGEGCVAGDGTAELYDPATGVFRPAGRMVAAHANHAAVLLPSGKVLLVGGNLARGGVARPAPAELYDPGTAGFQALGWAAAFGSSATLLPGGRVFIAGGWNSPSFWIYDPGRGVLSPAGSLATYPIGMYWHTATLLGNGSVLIAGGADDGDGANTLGNAELYDPASGTFTRIVPMRPRSSHTATLLPGGSVLMAGGGYSPVEAQSAAVAEIYDSTTASFTATGAQLAARGGHTATLLVDGRVLLAGGGSFGSLGVTEIYTPHLRAISAASFTTPLAPGSLASLVGSRLASSTWIAGPGSPLAPLGGISLRVRDSAGQTRLARLLYASPAQINFEIPPQTSVGDARIELVNNASTTTEVTVPVLSVAPGLFALPDGRAAAYGLRIEPDGSQTVLPPGGIVLDERPVYLVVYATGIRNRSSLSNVEVAIGGIRLPVIYAGPAGDETPGLDQFNFALPLALKGNAHRLTLTAGGLESNSVVVEVR